LIEFKELIGKDAKRPAPQLNSLAKSTGQAKLKAKTLLNWTEDLKTGALLTESTFSTSLIITFLQPSLHGFDAAI
jgi:hypothetical protein